MDLSQGEYKDIILAFRDMVVSLNSLHDQLTANVNECDKEFCDIRHYCELNDEASEEQKCYLYELIQTVSRKRRKSKDMLYLIEPLLGLASSDYINNLGRVTNETVKRLKRNESERIYTPRVIYIDKIFHSKEDDGEDTYMD